MKLFLVQIQISNANEKISEGQAHLTGFDEGSMGFINNKEAPEKPQQLVELKKSDPEKLSPTDDEEASDDQQKEQDLLGQAFFRLYFWLLMYLLLR